MGRKKDTLAGRFAPMDLVCLVNIILTFVAGVLVIAIPSSNAHTKELGIIRADAAKCFAVMGFLPIGVILCIQLVLFVALRERYKLMSIIMISLCAFGLLFFAIASFLAFKSLPNTGAWAMGAGGLTFVALINAFIQVKLEVVEK